MRATWLDNFKTEIQAKNGTGPSIWVPGLMVTLTERVKRYKKPHKYSNFDSANYLLRYWRRENTKLAQWSTDNPFLNSRRTKIKESQLCEIAPQSSKKSPREIKSLLLKFLFFFFALLIVLLIAGARTADKFRGLSEEEAAAAEVVTPVLKEIVEIDEFVFVEQTSNDDMRKKNTVC